MEENNNSSNTKNILGLLKKLAQIEFARARVNAGIFLREAQQQAQDKTTEFGKVLWENAKQYGRRAQNYVEKCQNNEQENGNIIKEFKECLAKVNAEYTEQLKAVLMEKNELEYLEDGVYSQELQARNERKKFKKSPEYLKYDQERKTLKEEIDRCYENGDFDLVKEKIEEAKSLNERNPLTQYDQKVEAFETRTMIISKLIYECDKQIESLSQERQQKIEEITANKDTQLAEIKPKNLAEKLFGKILNKLNGANKFKNNVLSKAMQKIKQIQTEELPKLTEYSQKKLAEFMEYMGKKRENAKEFLVNTGEAIVDVGLTSADAVVYGAETVVHTGQNIIKGGAKIATETYSKGKNMAAKGIEFAGNTATKAFYSGKQTINGIISRGREAKENLISGIEQRLEDEISKAQERLDAKQEPKKEETAR